MLLRLLYDDKLAQASYFVGCQATGDALAIDPARNIDQYLELTDSEGMNITAVTETHIHADCVSGSRELAAATGATLYLSDEGDENWKYQFADEAGAMLVTDGDEFKVGNINLRVMHSPGHTSEHISFILTDMAGADEPMGIFTGDFVFVGDVGRPDLLETAAGFEGTMEAGARTLYQSLQRFKELPDYLQIWPGHGAGSACGKALGAVPQSTVGYEKLFNWALTTKTEDEFVEVVLDGQPEPPFYFKEMKRVNKVGPSLVADKPLPDRLAPETIDEFISDGTPVVDMRSQLAFAGGHIPGTLSIPFSRSYLTWAGWLLPYDRPITLIVDERDLESTVRDLQRIGFDDIVGYWTPDVVTAWASADEDRELESTAQISIDDVEEALASGLANVLDVRGTSEYLEGHLPGALSVPLGYIPRQLDDIPDDKPLIVHCQTGARSSIAASLLQKLGRTNVGNYMGSFGEWSGSGKPVERGAAEREAVPAD
ncbi:MBL fold metallo-hydrolase [soil metagenome]